jgi:hypothetical protein
MNRTAGTGGLSILCRSTRNLSIVKRQLSDMTGRYFFEEKSFAVAVDSSMLQSLLGIEQGQNRTRKKMRNVRFQQDGAMAHMASQSMTFFRGMFPDCIISCSGNIPLLPHSPNLTTLDVFL